MAGLTAEQFRKLFPQANNEPITKALSTGLSAISTPMNQYRLPEGVPLLGGQSAADLTGLTGAQGVVQDFSRGNLQSGDMRMFDLLGLGAGVAPAARAAVKGGGLLGKEALRQMNEGTGLLSKLAPDPRQYIDAYHGSPYIFDKFNMNKIGTGEGHQAYGHGLYFADSPDVASSYKGITVSPRLRMAYDDAGGDWSKAAQIATEKAKSDPSWAGIADEALESSKKGNLYKVDLPDEHIANMLDWDKPLSEQSQAIQDIAAEQMGLWTSESPARQAYVKSKLNLSGEDLYGNLTSSKGSQQLASQELNKLGIKGIKYLDSNSIGAGKGSSNYVVFDDKLPTILERNGKSAGLLGTKKN